MNLTTKIKEWNNMNINKTKLKIGIWYEDENGNKIETIPGSPEPVTKDGAGWCLSFLNTATVPTISYSAKR